MPLSVGSRIAQYQVLDRIGAGAMGEVYRARDTRLDREVALKVLPDEFAQSEERLRRFEREGKSLASLIRVFCVDDHEALISCYQLAIDSELDMAFVGSRETTEGLVQAIEATQPSVLVLDLLIRGCVVFEALGEIHARFRTMAVLVASAFDERHMIEEVLRRGASGFVPKGDLGKLTRAIRVVAAGARVNVERSSAHSFARDPKVDKP